MREGWLTASVGVARRTQPTQRAESQSLESLLSSQRVGPTSRRKTKEKARKRWVEAICKACLGDSHSKARGDSMSELCKQQEAREGGWRKGAQERKRARPMMAPRKWAGRRRVSLEGDMRSVGNKMRIKMRKMRNREKQTEGEFSDQQERVQLGFA